MVRYRPAGLVPPCGQRIPDLSRLGWKWSESVSEHRLCREEADKADGHVISVKGDPRGVCRGKSGASERGGRGGENDGEEKNYRAMHYNDSQK